MCDHPIEQACECETEAERRLYLLRMGRVICDRLHAMRASHATLHSELVKVRVALGEMEAERNRLAGENRRLHIDLDAATGGTP